VNFGNPRRPASNPRAGHRRQTPGDRQRRAEPGGDSGLTPERNPPEDDRALPRWLLAAWALTGIVLALAAWISLRRVDRAQRADWERRLSVLADDRLAIADRAIEEWREDARLLAGSENVRALVSGPAPSGEAAERARRDIDELARTEPQVAVGIVDGAGQLRASSTGAQLFGEAGLASALRALAETHAILGQRDSPGPERHALEIAEPVPGPEGRPSGAVLFTVKAPRAMATLFPGSRGSSPERLHVVLREGDALLVVAPERWGEDGSSYSVPAADRTTYASAALRAARTSGEFSDGRGNRVLAATRRIPEIGWGIVIEVDRESAFPLWRGPAPWIVFAAAASFAAAVGAGLAWYRSTRVRHLERMAERDKRYKTLLEQTQDAVLVAVDGRVAYANPACVGMFGYERPLLGVPVTIFFAPGSREHIAEFVEQRVAGRPAPELYEAVGLRSDGSTFDVEVRVTQIEFDGRPGSQAVLRDITGRKRMEAGLRESEERYRLLFERNLAGVYRSTADGRLLECNWAFARLLGYASPAETMAHPEWWMHENPGAHAEFWQRLRKEGSIINHEGQARRKDGTPVWVIQNVSLLADEDGEEMLLGTVFDVTERRRLEEQLLQSQKMEAVGRLAGGIAHDFNNLLTAIAGYSDLLLAELPENDSRRESAVEIREAGRRAAGLTQQLLAFSRRQVLEPRVLDLNAVIAGMEKMLRRVIGEDIELTAALDPDLWRTMADPGQIEQAIVNLAVNARDAMPRGGQLTLETANVTLDEKFASAYATVQPGPHVMLAVSDTGVGMDAALQSRLFEPFFTTKERGKGTGLGLSTTYGIVKQSGGSIWVYSEPGLGTTFKIYLPRCEENLAEREAPPVPVSLRPGTETILLVEDEAEVRRLVERLLRMHGYAVLAAASPAEAIASAKGAGRIDLLVTDVIMPGMNGREMARLLAAERPRMRVLYMSGYTDAAIAQQGILPPGQAFLSKPFTPDLLARKVREVLDGGGGN
jgi:PAS domain S-box-containing protein